jgi:hypothetical protein
LSPVAVVSVGLVSGLVKVGLGSVTGDAAGAIEISPVSGVGVGRAVVSAPVLSGPAGASTGASIPMVGWMGGGLAASPAVVIVVIAALVVGVRVGRGVGRRSRSGSVWPTGPIKLQANEARSTTVPPTSSSEGCCLLIENLVIYSKSIYSEIFLAVAIDLIVSITRI